MELHRYDIIEAKLNYGAGSIQRKRRPYIIVSNEKGTTNASIITVMPLTHIIKKEHLPVHGCLEAETETGLSMYSMILGEQPQTICKGEVIKNWEMYQIKSRETMLTGSALIHFFTEKILIGERC